MNTEATLQAIQQIHDAVTEKLGENATPIEYNRWTDLAVRVYCATLIAAEIRKLGMGVTGVVAAAAGLTPAGEEPPRIETLGGRG